MPKPSDTSETEGKNYWRAKCTKEALVIVISGKKRGDRLHDQFMFYGNAPNSSLWRNLNLKTVSLDKFPVLTLCPTSTVFSVRKPSGQERDPSLSQDEISKHDQFF